MSIGPTPRYQCPQPQASAAQRQSVIFRGAGSLPIARIISNSGICKHVYRLSVWLAIAFLVARYSYSCTWLPDMPMTPSAVQPPAMQATPKMHEETHLAIRHRNTHNSIHLGVHLIAPTPLLALLAPQSPEREAAAASIADLTYACAH